MKDKIITIFGASGFLGKYVVKELAKQGYRINAVSRRPSQNGNLKVMGQVGQIAVTYCNYNDISSVRKAMRNSSAVINLVGVLYEKRKNTFKKVHTDFPEMLAKICNEFKIKKFIHLSAMGVDASQSKYAKSKLEGEKAINATYKNAIIIRPNIMFGEEDNFFNMFAKMAMVSPFLPAIGCGKTKFQPVYVADVAESIAKLVNCYEAKPGIYELAGNEQLTLKEILNYIKTQIKSNSRILSIPFSIAKIMGSFLSLLPAPLLTSDQVESLKYDCVQVNKDVMTFKDLKIVPTKLDLIVPEYLVRYKITSFSTKDMKA